MPNYTDGAAMLLRLASTSRDSTDRALEDGLTPSSARLLICFHPIVLQSSESQGNAGVLLLVVETFLGSPDFPHRMGACTEAMELC